jgi:hypothetical protein
MIDAAVAELAPIVGVRDACAAVGETQARWYRRHRQSLPLAQPERMPAPPPRALSEIERKELRRVLNSAEFVDEAPATVYAELGLPLARELWSCRSHDCNRIDG